MIEVTFELLKVSHIFLAKAHMEDAMGEIFLSCGWEILMTRNQSYRSTQKYFLNLLDKLCNNCLETIHSLTRFLALCHHPRKMAAILQLLEAHYGGRNYKPMESCKYLI